MQRQGRRVLCGTTLGVLLLATAARATAQTAPAPELPGAPAEAAVPAAMTVDVRSDEVWHAYDEAFAALVRGEQARARQLLGAIILLNPTHPAAALARALGATPPPRSASGKTNAARAELVVFQTLHGVVAGLEVCGAADCTKVRARALSLMAMGGLGLGLSLGLSRDGVRPGDTAAIDAGAFWGGWNGYSLAAAYQASGAHAARALLIGQGLGLGAGLLFATVGSPTAGQVSLSSTLATWSTTMTLLALIIANDNNARPTKELWVPLTLASDLGLAAGAALGHDSSISRGRTGLIDVGGVLGLGLGALVVAGDRQVTGRQAGLSIMAGTAVGLICATLATSSWDAHATATAPPGLPATMNLVPTPEPGGGGLALGGTF